MVYDYWTLLSELLYSGKEIETRGLKTKELRRVQLHVDHYNTVSHPKYRPWSKIKEYLFAEFSWFMTGERYLRNILPYSKFWGKIANPDGTANSNYGDLVFYRNNSRGISSFNWALLQLIEDKNTRKALVLYNDREFFYPENKDLICNQYQHFLIRDNKLECDVGLRSSDAIYGLTFNIPWWSLVHQQMFLILKNRYPKLELGNIVANIGSSHIYENKWELVKNIVSSSEREYRFITLTKEIPMLLTFEGYMKQVFPTDRDSYFENTI